MVTLQTIADELGVSASTVSRVVNKKGYVKESTRQRIAEAVKRRNYFPYNAARSLKTGQSHAIGVIIPDVTEIFFTNVLSSVEAELSEAGYSMLLCITGEDKNKEALYLNFFSQNHADGIILATVADDLGPLLEILDRGRSIVCIDNLPDTVSAFDAVISDNVYASELAVNYLSGLGHKRIAMITGKQTETTGVERLTGYRKAMEKLFGTVDDKLIGYGDYKEQSGYTAMKNILGISPDITAVHAASSKMTYGAVKAIYECGKKVPDDISVVGFDVYDPTGLIKPGITTIRQQEDGIGKMACRLLLESIRRPEHRVRRKILLQPELVVRDSCRNL